jgi:hypothetical protein
MCRWLALQGTNLYKTVNGVHRDIVDRYYQGITYFQHVIWIHGAGVNVISLTPLSKGWLSVPLHGYQLYQISSKSVKIYGRRVETHLRA